MITLECMVSNVVIAAFLALVAAIVGKFTTQPQITHTLWLLVLVKLVTPPVVQIPVSYPMLTVVDTPAVLQTALTSDGSVSSVQRPNDIHDGVRPASKDKTEFGNSPYRVAANAPLPNQAVEESKLSWIFVAPWAKLLVGVWITGSLFWFLLAGTRLFRFRRLLRFAIEPRKNCWQKSATLLPDMVFIMCRVCWLWMRRYRHLFGVLAEDLVWFCRVAC